jgi:signal transduction histidine kinase
MALQGTLEDPADSFKQLGDLGQQALREMRLLIHQLRPPILEKVGLVQALQQRLDAVELRASVESRLMTRRDVENIPHVHEDQLFYIAQEALNNSLRHASAENVIVRIYDENDCIHLFVEDDGRGFDPDEATAGLGLKSMQERAESLQGHLAITSAPDQGTMIKVSVPLTMDKRASSKDDE